jgi:hypothetical protein
MSYKSRKLEKLAEQAGYSYTSVFWGWDDEGRHGWIFKNHTNGNSKFFAPCFEFAEAVLIDKINYLEEMEEQDKRI